MRKIMQSNKAIYFIAALASILLSIWQIEKTWVINPDGVCYLQSAATVFSHGINYARHVCSQAAWPFYSILIAIFAKIFHCSNIFAANILNGFFSLLSVLFFISIIKQLSKNKTIHWLGTLTILIAHQFNILRPDIIRDHGYWAFYLLSISLLLRYFASEINSYKINFQKITLALSWSFSLIIATLFRIEGAIFLILLPFAAFLFLQNKISQRLKDFLQLSSITIIAAFTIIIWLSFHPHASLGRIDEIIKQISHGPMILLANFNHAANQLAQHVLSIYSQHDASSILFEMLVAWYVVNQIGNLSVVFAGLIIFAWLKNIARWNVSQKLIIWSYVLINILITFLFLVEDLFLAKRYIIALSLTMIIWVPFALSYLMQKWRNKYFLLFLLSFSLLLVSIGGIVNFGPNKKYIRQAGDWLNQHSADQAKIYSNDFILRYYSGHFNSGNFAFNQDPLNTILENHHWQDYDWLALHLDEKESKFINNKIPFKPVKTFRDQRRGDLIWIYRINHATNNKEVTQ